MRRFLVLVLAMLDALKGVAGLACVAVGTLLAVGTAWMFVAIGVVLLASAATDRTEP